MVKTVVGWLKVCAFRTLCQSCSFNVVAHRRRKPICQTSKDKGGGSACNLIHTCMPLSICIYIYIHAWYICISMQEKVYIIYNSYNIYACTLCYTYIYYIIYILCTVTECVYIRLCTYCILRLQRASSPHIILNTCKNATFNEPI